METPVNPNKRAKREIANSNERRRMQSINAGFQKLKRLLPVNDGEKLSKAAILQHAAEFIQQIELDKLILHEQNTRLKGFVTDLKRGTTTADTIDLDSLQNIPSATHISVNLSASATSTTPETPNNASTDTNNNNSNRNIGRRNNSISLNLSTSSSTENSNDDSTKEAIMNKIGNYTSGKEVSNNRASTRAPGKTKCNTINESSSISHNTSNNYQELTQAPVTSVTEIISDRVASPNGLVSIGVAKAAIALPLEVPYTSETAIMRRHDLHTPQIKIEKTNPTSTNIDSQEPSPKGQTLDTICKAIMEIEGDRVFT